MKRQIKSYVIIGLLACAGMCTSPPTHAAVHPMGDGRISLYSYHTNDVLEITFRTATGYDEEALKKIHWVMRSRGDDDIYPISTELIDVLDNIQDHFGAETIEIISGYRSKPFNEFLRASGRGAASESLHTKGMAADIHIDEVTEKAVWDYVQSLGAGGAGYYPRHNFVHVDVGPKRIWRESDPKERVLTGLDLNPNEAWYALTDKNLYAPGESIELTITNKAAAPATLAKNFWYSHFRKGRWSKRDMVERSKGHIELKPGQSYRHILKPGKLGYGKYRIILFPEDSTNKTPAYSNEFYVKK